MVAYKANLALHLPAALEEHLFHSLAGDDRLRDPVWLADFRAAIRRGYVPNYYYEAVPFQYLFFGANFLKARKACQTFIQCSQLARPTYRILDLGCGAGASSAGILDFLAGSHKHTAIQLIAVDRNATQLSLYRDVFLTWAQSIARVSSKLVLADVIEFLKANPDGWDLIVCSYVLAEHPPAWRRELSKLLEVIARTGTTTVLLIDSEESSPDGIARCLSTRKQIEFHETPIKFHLLHTLCTEVCPKYCVDRPASLSVIPPDPLAAYFACWRKQDPVGIRNIFNTQATYEINARRRIAGLDSILEYWEQNALIQREVECIVHDYTCSSREQVAHWTARFRRTDRDEIYAVHGILWMELNGGFVARLCEYYTKNTFPLP